MSVGGGGQPGSIKTWRPDRRIHSHTYCQLRSSKAYMPKPTHCCDNLMAPIVNDSMLCLERPRAHHVKVTATDRSAQHLRGTQNGLTTLNDVRIQHNISKITLTQQLPPTPPPSIYKACLLYTSPSPRDRQKSRMPSSA